MTIKAPPPSPAPAAPDHTRTPDNTAVPGGGSWAWDAVAGSWVAPVADPILHNTTPE